MDVDATLSSLARGATKRLRLTPNESVMNSLCFAKERAPSVSATPRALSAPSMPLRAITDPNPHATS